MSEVDVGGFCSVNCLDYTLCVKQQQHFMAWFLSALFLPIIGIRNTAGPKILSRQVKMLLCCIIFWFNTIDLTTSYIIDNNFDGKEIIWNVYTDTQYLLCQIVALMSVYLARTDMYSTSLFDFVHFRSNPLKCHLNRLEESLPSVLFKPHRILVQQDIWYKDL